MRREKFVMKKNFMTLAAILVFLIIALGTPAVYATVVNSTHFTSQNLIVTSLGSNTALGTTGGAYTLGPSGGSGQYERCIIPFNRSDFAGINTPLTAARLKFNITTDFAETGESYISELRMFTTNSALDDGTKNTFASLTGDGGSYTAIGTIALPHGITGFQTIEFTATGLLAMENAIKGSSTTIGFSFREFAGNDELDEFVISSSTGGVYLEVIPEPATIAMLILGALSLLTRKK